MLPPVTSILPEYVTVVNMSARESDRTAGKPKAYHHGDLRRALLEQATAMLAGEGAGALSLREVSERVGVSHTAAYRHFRDKAELLAAIRESGFRRLRERLGAVREAAEVRHRLAAMASEYVAFALEEPAKYRLMFGPGFCEQVSAGAVAEAARDAFGELLEAVIEGQKGRLLREGSPFLMSQTIWAMLHGLALFYLDGELDPEKEITEQCWQFLFRGIGSPRSGS